MDRRRLKLSALVATLALMLTTLLTPVSAIDGITPLNDPTTEGIGSDCTVVTVR